MDNEGIIDQAEIDALLDIANKEIIAPELELEQRMNGVLLPQSQDNNTPFITSPKNTLMISQIWKQQHLRKAIVAVFIMLILAILGGGFLGYKREQQTFATPLPLEKIIQMGITFEVKNLVAYAGRGDRDIVTAFLNAGMDINGSRGSDGWTALTAASFYKKSEVVQLLLEKNATVNIQDLSGNTPLMYAAAMGAEDIVSMLLEAGANPNIQNKLGRTALNEAYSKQQAIIAEILKNAGANPQLTPLTKSEETFATPPKKLRKENDISPSVSTIKEENRLTAGRAGLVQIGMPLEDLQQLYPSLILREEYIAGNKEMTATIVSPANSLPLLKIELSNGKIPRVSVINIYMDQFSTDKNITLNSTVGDIRNQYPSSEIKVIDNSLFLVVKNMKILFELNIDNVDIPINWLKNGDINSIPSTTKITRMILY